MAMYRRLSVAEKQIRVVTVYPGHLGQMIRCGFQTVSLNDEPDYEALSYVWGLEQHRLYIELNLTQTSVTRNLHAALNRLRHPDEPRRLWVDAICINQADNEERGQQVALMGEIYSKTTRGIIFLGEEVKDDENETLEERRQLQNFFAGTGVSGALSPLYQQFQAIRAAAGSDSQEVINMAISMSLSPQLVQGDNIIRPTRPCVWHGDDRDDSLIQQAWDQPSLRSDTIFHAFCLLRRLSNGEHPSLIWYFASENSRPGNWRPSAEIRALKWLGERPWWKRVWTVQECILPKQCVVVYGPVQAPWSMFQHAMSNLHRHRISCCAFVPGISEALSSLSTIMSDIQDVRIWRQHRDGVALSTLMRIFRYRQATDIRDKVYGFLGLVTDWGADGPSSITPNYTKAVTHQQVFTRSTAAIIQSSRSLDILCQPANIDIDYFSLLPSWVIDYSLPVSALGTADRYNYQIPLYQADRCLPASVSVIEENTLAFNAVHIDTLSPVYDAVDAGYSEPPTAVLKQWFDKAGQEKSLPPTWQKDFWRVLCGDTVVGSKATYRRARNDDEPVFNSWWRDQGLGELGGASSQSTNPPAAKSIVPAVKAATTRRKFFVSQKGYMGLAPDTAGRAATVLLGKEEIFVIPGGRIPFLLRPAGVRHVPGIGMQRCHHFVGDCYVQGFMDGESMRNFVKDKQTIYLV